MSAMDGRLDLAIECISHATSLVRLRAERPTNQVDTHHEIAPRIVSSVTQIVSVLNTVMIINPLLPTGLKPFWVQGVGGMAHSCNEQATMAPKAHDRFPVESSMHD